MNKLLDKETVALYECRDGYCNLPCSHNTARLAHQCIQGHLMSMILMSFENQYSTSY